MKWTLEVVVVPVTDIDRAKAFYADQVGFVIGKGAVPDMPPGSLKGLQLVVPDIHRARAELLERGVTVSEVQRLGENPVPVADPLDNVGFVFFNDPDGNAWAVQQISSRT